MNFLSGTLTADGIDLGDAGKLAMALPASAKAGDKVTLEIEAEIPSGAPAQVVRTVTENSRTLKFTSQGFEVE